MTEVVDLTHDSPDCETGRKELDRHGADLIGGLNVEDKEKSKIAQDKRHRQSVVAVTNHQSPKQNILTRPTSPLEREQDLKNCGMDYHGCAVPNLDKTMKNCTASTKAVMVPTALKCPGCHFHTEWRHKYAVHLSRCDQARVIIHPLTAQQYLATFLKIPTSQANAVIPPRYESKAKSAANRIHRYWPKPDAKNPLRDILSQKNQVRKTNSFNTVRQPPELISHSHPTLTRKSSVSNLNPTSLQQNAVNTPTNDNPVDLSLPAAKKAKPNVVRQHSSPLQYMAPPPIIQPPYPQPTNPVFVCTHCSFKADMVEKMEKHLLQNHNSFIPSPNSSLPVTMPTTMPMIPVPVPRTFSCNHCQFRTSSELCMVRHLLSDHRTQLLPQSKIPTNGPKVFSCSFCSYSTTEALMVDHMLEHYKNHAACGSCSSCINWKHPFPLPSAPKKVNKPKRKTSSVLVTSKTGKKLSSETTGTTAAKNLFRCNFCGEKCSGSTQLQAHMLLSCPKRQKSNQEPVNTSDIDAKDSVAKSKPTVTHPKPQSSDEKPSSQPTGFSNRLNQPENCNLPTPPSSDSDCNEITEIRNSVPTVVFDMMSTSSEGSTIDPNTVSGCAVRLSPVNQAELERLPKSVSDMFSAKVVKEPQGLPEMPKLGEGDAAHMPSKTLPSEVCQPVKLHPDKCVNDIQQTANQQSEGQQSENPGNSPATPKKTEGNRKRKRQRTSIDLSKPCLDLPCVATIFDDPTEKKTIPEDKQPAKKCKLGLKIFRNTSGEYEAQRLGTPVTEPNREKTNLSSVDTKVPSNDPMSETKADFARMSLEIHHSLASQKKGPAVIEQNGKTTTNTSVKTCNIMTNTKRTQLPTDQDNNTISKHSHVSTDIDNNNSIKVGDDTGSHSALHNNASLNNSSKQSGLDDREQRNSSDQSCEQVKSECQSLTKVVSESEMISTDGQTKSRKAMAELLRSKLANIHLKNKGRSSNESSPSHTSSESNSSPSQSLFLLPKSENLGTICNPFKAGECIDLTMEDTDDEDYAVRKLSASPEKVECRVSISRLNTVDIKEQEHSTDNKPIPSTQESCKSNGLQAIDLVNNNNPISSHDGSKTIHQPVVKKHQSPKTPVVDVKPSKRSKVMRRRDRFLSPPSPIESASVSKLDEDDMVICPFCPKRLLYRLLSAHIQFHGSNCEHQCKDCDFSSSFKWVLDTHIACHKEAQTDARQITMEEWNRIKLDIISNDDDIELTQKLIIKEIPPEPLPTAKQTARKSVAKKTGIQAVQNLNGRRTSASSDDVAPTASANKHSAICTDDLFNRMISDVYTKK